MTVTINGTSGIAGVDGSAGTPAIQGADTNTGVFFPAADTVAITTGGSERMRVDSSGRLLIGTTTSPSSSDVKNVLSASTGAFTQYSFNGGAGAVVGSAAASTLAFYTYAGNIGAETYTERMRIDSSGNLQVGVSANYFGEKLTVYNSNASTAPVAFFYNPNPSTTGSVLYVQSEGASGTTWKLLTGRSASGVERVIIYGNGNIQNTNNSYGAISDIKLKENIVDTTPKLADLMQVKVRNYNLIGEETKQIGVIAQELEQVFPSMIEEVHDRDDKDNVLETTTKSVKYSVFVPMLIKAIQEQQAIITSLTARIEALEAK